MQTEPQITFRDMAPSPFVEHAIRRKIAALTKFHDRITGCHVTVEAPHKHHHQGRRYRVRVEITVPGYDLVVGREHGVDGAHEDVYVALRDAFRAARRQLEDALRREGRGRWRHHGAAELRVAAHLVRPEAGARRPP